MQSLTAEQRSQWTTEGYLKLKGVLSPDEVDFFVSEVDRIRQIPGFEPYREKGTPIGHYKWLPHASDLDSDAFMDRRDLLPYGKHFVDLMDRPSVFDLITDIMGPYIMLSMTQAVVRPADPEFPGYTHTDGGEALRRIRPSESSCPIAMKAMYILTDVSEPDSGNFTIFPGSHHRPFPYYRRDDPVMPHSPGSKQIMAEPGDVILFPHAMWHGPCRNLSGRSRKVLLYNYCQLFVRQYDFEYTKSVPEGATPRQRRLLGDLGYDFVPGSYFYGPTDQTEVILEENTAS